MRPTRFAILLGTLLLSTGLRAQPTAPTPDQIEQLRALERSSTRRAAASATPFTVDISSREEVRQFYRTIYPVSEGIPIQWTGSYSTGNAGTTSDTFKEAIRVRINFFRALVGVPAAITLNSTYSAKNQQAALMMSANNALSHYPPSSWTYYTADGAEAAANSNLAIGTNYYGPASITGYMIDSGSNNAAVGHRRWLMYPQTLLMGTGDVPDDAPHLGANSTWVIDSQFGSTRPATRTTAISYPPAGYVPYQLVFPRWSFSYPGADFSTATVSMTRNGSSVATTLEPISTGIGEPALVWVYDGLSSNSSDPHAKPSSDTAYTVNVNHVYVGGSYQNFTYNVTVFDPDVAGSGYAPATISIASAIPTGQASAYGVSVPSYVSHYETRTLQLATFAKTYNAESGLDGITASIGSPAYSVVVTSPAGAGTSSYHLAKPDPKLANDTLTLPELLYIPNSSASLTFLSRLGWATSAQSARVQVTTDEGLSWTDVYTQAGTGSSGESSYTTRTASLAAFAGRTIRIRFAYRYDIGNLYFDQTSYGVGWYIDNIAFSGVQSATAGTSTTAARGTAGSFTPSASGSYALQARGLYFGAYPMEWGTLAITTAAPGATITVQPQSQTVNAGTAVTLSVTASGSGLSYQWYKDGNVLSGATSSSYTISSPNTDHAGSYTVAVTNAGGTVTSSAATLTVVPLSYLSNLSVRAYMTGGQTLIVGFVVAGGAKPVLIRAAGPVLTPYGLPGVPDPSLALYNGSTLVASNNDWNSSLSSTFDAVGAFGFAEGSKDAALLQSINGPHTAQALADQSGFMLVEAYDAGPNDGRRFTNVSARFQVGTGDSILIAGFVVGGTGTRQILVRAVGPTLASYGVPGTLADPQFTVKDGDTTIASNNDWSASLSSTFATLGAFGLNSGSKDAALVVSLPAGRPYTVQVSGADGGTGEALVELYALP